MPENDGGKTKEVQVSEVLVCGPLALLQNFGPMISPRTMVGAQRGENHSPCRAVGEERGTKQKLWLCNYQVQGHHSSYRNTRCIGTPPSRRDPQGSSISQ